MRWLRQFLEAERSDATLWNWSFAGVGAVGLAGNLVWGAHASYDVRVARYFAATSSGLLLVLSALNPLRVETDAPPNATTCHEVRHRELVLVDLAKDEAKRRSALYHLVPHAFNLASSLTLGLAYDDQWRNAALTLAMSTFVTELRILTAPNDARTALRRYRHGDIGGDGAHAAWLVAPLAVGQNGGGVAVMFAY